MIGFPTTLLYVSNKEYCGLGMDQLSYFIQEAKNRMLHAVSVSPDPYLQAVAEALVDRAARAAGTVPIAGQEFVLHHNKYSTTTTWASSTTQAHAQV